MKKTTKLGLGVVAAALVSIGAYLGYLHFKEQNRIDEIAKSLKRYRGETEVWRHSYSFDLPTNPQVADWHNEDLKVPQILFTVPNDDKSKISIWAAGIDGSGLELLIPEGEVGLTPHVTFGTSGDYSRFISRSPNGRYVLVPQKGGLVLYDLETKEKTIIDGESEASTRVLWQLNSSQVNIIHSNQLLKIELPSKNITSFKDRYGKGPANIALTGDWTNKVLSRVDNRLYIQFERDGGGWFYCGENEFTEDFEPNIKTCGNTLVIDLNSLKVVGFDNYMPDEHQCRPNGSWVGNNFKCGDDIYAPGTPSKIIGQAELNQVLMHYSPKESWFISPQAFATISRYIPKPEDNSPVTEMRYSYRYIRNGETFILGDLGFAFSRYVLEHLDDNRWGQYLYPPLSYEDLNKAKARLKEQGYDY